MGRCPICGPAELGCRLRSVAILTPWFPNRPGDSAGAFIADSALALSRAGWRVGVLVVRPWVPPLCQRFAGKMVRGEIRPDLFAIDVLATARTPSLPRLLWRPLTDVISDAIIETRLEQMARQVSADVIHVHTEGFGPAPVRVARRLGLAHVVTLHGINMHPRYLHAPYQKARLRSGLSAADRIVLVGEPICEFFKDYIGSDRNFAVVANGVSPPLSMTDRPIFGNGPRRLVSVSNLHEGKGIDLTLRALARLNNEGLSDWTYRIIGEGQERSMLLGLTAELGLADRVKFVGPVRHAEIFDCLASAEVFVLPSYREAFGVAYLEAMAAGLVTIGVAGQGPSQFIRNAENGALVPPGDVDALVAVLRDILTGDRDRWRQIARAGQETVRKSYTWDHHARRLSEIYDEVIPAKTAPAACVPVAASAI